MTDRSDVDHQRSMLWQDIQMGHLGLNDRKSVQDSHPYLVYCSRQGVPNYLNNYEHSEIRRQTRDSFCSDIVVEMTLPAAIRSGYQSAEVHMSISTLEVLRRSLFKSLLFS